MLTYPGPLEDQLIEARNQLTLVMANANPAHPSDSAWIQQALHAVEAVADACHSKWSDLDALKAQYDAAKAPLSTKAVAAMFEDIKVDAEIKEAVRKARVREAVELALKEVEDSPSWAGADLAALVAGETTEVVPDVLQRSDGRGLVYRGRMNMLYGSSGSGKSLAMVAAVAQALDAGEVAVWVDYEESTADTTVGRLLALGVDGQAIVSNLHWVHPETPVSAAMLTRIATDARQKAGDRPVGLLVLDSVGEALAVEGANEDRDNEVGPWLARVRTVLGHLPEAALVLVDHSIKATDGPGRLFPSGSKRKRAALDGACWLVETVQEFAKGKAGSFQLVCSKDRHGNFERGARAALVQVAPGKAPGQLSVVVHGPGVGLVPVGELWPLVAQLVQAVKKAGEPVSQNAAEMAVSGGSNAKKRAALDLCVQLGVLHREKTAKGYRITFTRDLTHADSEQIKAVPA